ncbi:MAG: hypothetical protein HY749_05635 [Gammaproteobacteria bacterium]|nr:hypothetical protein [Gammaproteobacteria bacterium]MBI5615915.1 hypothetical protein [Gammaproteobacteria bacterium]
MVTHTFRNSFAALAAVSTLAAAPQAGAPMAERARYRLFSRDADPWRGPPTTRAGGERWLS